MYSKNCYGLLRLARAVQEPHGYCCHFFYLSYPALALVALGFVRALLGAVPIDGVPNLQHNTDAREDRPRAG
jgi:hypothetical protein